MTTAGHVETARPVESIVVGHRHRTDLGDLESLQRSIARLGLLQPITITPDGVLLCGLRRMEAVKRLGWRTVRCWVRSGISDDLGRLLAERDENTERKQLAPLEAAALYRELKTLFAEDAARRRQRTAFLAREVPGHKPPDGDESNDSPNYGSVAATTLGDLDKRPRERAAQLVTGNSGGYNRLEQLSALQQWATDPRQAPTIKTMAAAELEQIGAGAPVRPAYERVRRAIATVSAADLGRDAGTEAAADLDRLATQALQRIAAENRTKATTRAASDSAARRRGPRRRSPRWFTLTWSELDGWTTSVDVDELADELTDQDVATFERVLAETTRFAHTLKRARARREGAVA